MSTKIKLRSNNQKSSPTAINKKPTPPAPILLPLPQLLDRLSQYRALSELPTNPTTSQTLWSLSPCTYKYPQRNISMDKIQKFKRGSIYHRDNINQQRKVFTDKEKPQLLIKNFRRMVQEISTSKKYNNTQQDANVVKKRSLVRHTIPLDNHLYQVPNKIQLKHDRHGNRSAYTGQYDVKSIISNIKSTKVNFTSSQRIDLALPLNFNPGPGKYWAQNEDPKYMTHRTNKLVNPEQEQIVTERLTIKRSVAI